MVYKGETFTEYTKLYEQETTEPNGTEVIVPVKEEDRYYFREAMRTQLAYFETVVLVFLGTPMTDYKIYREENFQYSDLCEDNDIHICLKDVYYPIDWQKLGMDRINLGVALRFGLDSGLVPSPARETLIYNKKTIDLIKDKIKIVCEWFINKYNETITEEESFLQIYDELNPYNTHKVVIAGRSFELRKDVLTYGTLNKPKMKGVEILDLRRVYDKAGFLLFNYNIAGTIEGDKYSSRDTDYNNLFSRIRSSVQYSYDLNIIEIEDKPSRLLIDYIKYKYRTCLLVRKNNKRIPLRSKSSRENWTYILNLKTHNKKDWRQILGEFKLINDGLTKDFININDIVPNEQWLKDRKANKATGNRVTIESEEINPKYPEATSGGKYSTKFETGVPTKLSAFDINTTYIYGKIEEREELGKIHESLGRTIKVLVLVDRDIKKVKNKNLANWITKEEFMEGKLEVFGNFCTYVKIYRLINKDQIISNNIELIQKINSSFADKFSQLEDYCKNNEHKYNNSQGTLADEMLIICEEKDLWNKDIYDTYLEIKEEAKDLEFLNHVKRKATEGYSYRDNYIIDTTAEEFVINYYNTIIKNKTEVYAEQ